jgi:hypothetical protein
MEDIMNNRKLHFTDLSEYDKKYICNGCGPKKCKHKFPDYIFTTACNFHDFRYWRGGNELDRINADLYLLLDMINAILFTRNLGIIQGIYYFIWATVYYLSCLIGGWGFFLYGKRKTFSDLPSVKDGYR